jgi:hypothetical protein
MNGIDEQSVIFFKIVRIPAPYAHDKRTSRRKIQCSPVASLGSLRYIVARMGHEDCTLYNCCHQDFLKIIHMNPLVIYLFLHHMTAIAAHSNQLTCTRKVFKARVII